MTTKNEIAQWFDEGVELGATHMLVVCDTFDWSDYPVYVRLTATPGDGGTVHECADMDTALGRHAVGNMRKLMEVYDLAADKAEQFAEHRAMRIPDRSSSGE